MGCLQDTGQKAEFAISTVIGWGFWAVLRLEVGLGAVEVNWLSQILALHLCTHSWASIFRPTLMHYDLQTDHLEPQVSVYHL